MKKSLRHTKEYMSNNQILIDILIANYKAPNEVIPEDSRANYLNALIVVFSKSSNASRINEAIMSLKTEDNPLLGKITQQTWGKVALTLNQEELKNLLNDTHPRLADQKVAILRGVEEQILSLKQPKRNVLLDFVDSQLGSLPPERSNFNELQQLGISMLLKIASKYQRNDIIRKKVSGILGKIFNYLNTEEKEQFINFYKINLENKQTVAGLEFIKKEIVFNYPEVTNLINSKIQEIEKLEGVKLERAKKRKLAKSKKQKGKTKRAKSKRAIRRSKKKN